MHGQITGAVQGDGIAVPAVQRSQVLASLHPPRVAGDSDHELGDDVRCEDVEEVLTVDQAVQPFQDDPEERIQGLELIAVRGRHDLPQSRPQ